MKTRPLDRPMKPEQVESKIAASKVAVQGDHVIGSKDPRFGPGLPNRAPQRNRLNMSTRMVAVAVGMLFLVQMVTFMIGSALVESFLAGDATQASLRIGVFFEICAGLAVVGIGFLMYPLLKAVNRKLAIWYPALRVVEFTVSASLAVYLLTQLTAVPNHLLWIYIPTGIGGMILGYLLFVSKLVPQPVALLGLAGYALFLVGVPVDLFSPVDMNSGAGMILLLPGGLFEILVLPAWLIAKGFNLPAGATNHS